MRSGAPAEVRGTPTIIFAYTIKGYGLAIAGRPQNHSAFLNGGQIDAFRELAGLTPEREWDRFTDDSLEAELLNEARAQLERPAARPAALVHVPVSLTGASPARVSTQASFGRQMLDLSRHEEIAQRLVTVSPDVSVSTSLGGWINKVGVWGPKRSESSTRWPTRHSNGGWVAMAGI